AAMRSPVVSTFRANGDVVEAQLAPDAAAPSLEELGVDLGPFTQESVTKDKLTLRRRSGSGVETLEVLGTSGEQEEWRRLMARDVDLVPFTTPSHLRYLADVPSIRVIPVEQSAVSGLFFNVSGPVLHDLRLRQAISLGLRRAAIAEVVADNPELA